MSSNSTGGIDPELWNIIVNIRTGCFPYVIDGLGTAYGYWPSFAAGVTFCVLFGLTLIGHVVQTARFRRWTSVMLALGALTETIGWAGRTWSAKCPYAQDAFLMQITTLIIAPTFFAAALYVLLGMLITRVGRDTSLLSPRAYTIIFCTCDVISLVVQAVGGALASTASDRIDGDTAPGTHTMVGGIVFQLFTMTVFAALVFDFLRRVYAKNRGGAFLSSQVKKVLFALFVAFVMIYVRSIYRTIELAQGWEGYLITREGYFIGLDAALMFVAVGVFLVFDPAVLLRDEEEGMMKGGVEGKVEGGDTSDSSRVVEGN